jgi:hypothetical protein
VGLIDVACDTAVPVGRLAMIAITGVTGAIAENRNCFSGAIAPGPLEIPTVVVPVGLAVADTEVALVVIVVDTAAVELVVDPMLDPMLEMPIVVDSMRRSSSLSKEIGIGRFARRFVVWT